MSSIESVEVKVDRLIGEIRQLKIARDGVEEGNRMEGLRLQSEIFRKFGTVDCLLLSISTGEPREEIQRLKEKVLEEKKMAEATLEDLEKMAFPQMEVEGEKEKAEFPLFMDLLPELRTMILEYLTSVSDKLNVSKAVPDAEELTGWKIADLEFVQILSILLKEKKLESQHLLNLTQVSQTVRDFVYSKFYKSFDTPFETEGESCQDYALERFFQTKPTVPLQPIPVNVNIHIWTGTVTARTLKNLAKYGKDLWACGISYSAGMSPLENLRTIRDCLLLMPNLRHLSFWNTTPGLAFLEEAAFLENPLPDLPHLVEFEISGVQNMQFDEELVRKYGPSVKGFKRSVGHSFFVIRDCARMEAPQLSTLHLKVWPPLSSSVRMSNDLNRFMGSPLRSVKILGGYVHNTEGDFEYLFTTLRGFGSTLEELEIQLLQRLNEDLPAAGNLTWLADVNFPKLKTLAIEGTPKTWAILLSFPAMEMLTLKKVGPAGDAYFQTSGFLELSWNKAEMYTSNIWKLLPFLKTVNFVKGNGNGNVEKYAVSRKQCLAFQKKSAALPQTGQ